MKTQAQTDFENLELELAEVAETNRKVSQMSDELATALMAAYRLLVNVSRFSSVQEQLPAQDWQLIESTVDRLIEARGY